MISRNTCTLALALCTSITMPSRFVVVGCIAVTYLADAVSAGRISEGYVVLASGKPSEVVSSKPVAEVVALLEGVRPRDWQLRELLVGRSGVPDRPVAGAD